MKLPRDLSGRDLAKALQALGYSVTRQTGSHLRLTTTTQGEHHVTVPDHDALRVGTLSGVLADVAAPFNLTREELMKRLFGSRAPRKVRSAVVCAVRPQSRSRSGRGAVAVSCAGGSWRLPGPT